MSCPGSVNKFY